MDGFEHMIQSRPQGRDEAALMHAIVGHSSTRFQVGQMGTSHEMETLRNCGVEASKAHGIVVREDVEQAVERRVE